MNKTIIILGGDGYLGWPLSMKLALQHPDQKIIIVDNQWRRETVGQMGFQPLVPILQPDGRIAAFHEHYGLSNLHYQLFDICSDKLERLIMMERPHTIYHLAQQCSAPYSMMGVDHALYTLRNNEEGNMRLLWAVHTHVPFAHIIKLGSFGEYAKGSIPIAEGYFKPAYRGIAESQNMPYPRAANDIYHVSKINDSNYVGMASRMWDLRITEVMQSTVFGIFTEEMSFNPGLYTRFDCDTVFGTVANRFVAQAVTGNPLTIYGNGCQRTGLMALPDAVNSLSRFVTEQAGPGEHRVINHITEVEYSIKELADAISEIALDAGMITECVHFDDIRKEDVETKAVYQVESSLLTDAAFHSDFREVICETMRLLQVFQKPLSKDYFAPSISWKPRPQPRQLISREYATGIADVEKWEELRREFFDSPQLNLNPGCLGTLAVSTREVFNKDKSGRLRGNPLALYASSRVAYSGIKKECAVLWPSPGYRLAVTQSTSQLMNLLALSMLRKLLEKGTGPFCVITTRHEHAGAIGPFERLPEYNVFYLDDEILATPHRLAEQLVSLQPDIVLLSHVYYDLGVVAQDNHSLRVIKEAVPQAWLILDVAQSIGIEEIPIGVADLITGSTHKWLFGPYGGGLTWINNAFAQWLGALFWNGMQFFSEEDTYGFSLPGGQDFHLYDSLYQCLKLYRNTGPEAILTRSSELGKFLRPALSAIFIDAGIDHFFTNNNPSPSLVVAFLDYDPYPLYCYLNDTNIHIKCIKHRKLSNGKTTNLLRIGLPYYESKERLNRLLSEIEAFLICSVRNLSTSDSLSIQ